MGYILDLRKLVGKRPLLMPCTGVILGDGKGKVLLQLRADNKKWAIHGGSIEIDEEVEEALLREVNEELGIHLNTYNYLKTFSGKEFHFTYPNGDEVSIINIVYYSHDFTREFKLQKDEVLEVKWFSKNELPEDIFEVDRKVLEEYFSFLEKNKK